MVAFATSSLGFEICRDPDPVGWDEALVTIPGGHALQTWEWGEAKRSVGETVERFLISRAGNPVLLAQVFQKRVSALKLKTAWIPRGPVICLLYTSDAAD